MKDRYSTVNGAQNLMQSHITKVFFTSSVKLQLPWWKSILNIITQLSSPPNSIKFFFRHDWTKLNIWKNQLKKQGVFYLLQERFRSGDKIEF